MSKTTIRQRIKRALTAAGAAANACDNLDGWDAVEEHAVKVAQLTLRNLRCDPPALRVLRAKGFNPDTPRQAMRLMMEYQR